MLDKELNSNTSSATMQGERSSLGSLNDGSAEQTSVWNDTFPNYTHDMAAEYITSNFNNSSTYLNTVSQAQSLGGWNLGESGSGGTQNHAIQNEPKREDGSSNDITVRGANLNLRSGNVAYPSLLIPSGSNHTSPGNLNIGVEVGENSSDIWQVAMENTRAPSSARGPSCKRKAVEGQIGHIGQSSSGGSSDHFQPRVGNGWNSTPGFRNMHVTASASSTPSEDLTVASGPSGGNTSGNTLPLNLAPNTESARRSNRLRLNASPLLSSSSPIHPSRGIQRNASPITYSQMSGALHNFSAIRRPESLRWGSNSRAGSSSSLGLEEIILRGNEETNASNLRLNIPEIPTSLPPSEASFDYSSQLLPHWGLSRENASISVPPVPEPNGIHHSNPYRYSRRFTEYVRRTLSESGGQNSNSPVQTGSSSQQGAPSSGAGLRSAVMLETQLESAPGGTSSSRSAATGLEERRRIVSEIRSVLDRMRRGEGLRIEDMAILDQSIFSEMVGIHDRHRDMRLDVDNMSYEELLALEERMGDVNTGLSDETIENQLKHKKFFSIAMGVQTEVEPCCICREDYNDGEDIGTVECGHEFHSECIKQWLKLKNSCPICKTPALKK